MGHQLYRNAWSRVDVLTSGFGFFKISNIPRLSTASNLRLVWRNIAHKILRTKEYPEILITHDRMLAHMEDIKQTNSWSSAM